MLSIFFFFFFFWERSVPRCAGSRPVNLVHFDSGLVSVFVLVDGQGGWTRGGFTSCGESGCGQVVGPVCWEFLGAL